MSRLHELAASGQSVWLDFIRRSHTRDGDLARLRELGIRGMTSNPAIFEKAIGASNDYDTDLARLVDDGCSTMNIYESLALADIGEAADMLRPVYDSTGGGDGFVSIEVDPGLAHDTDSTIAEARRLFAAAARPNVMIKVPATPAGIPAVQQLIAGGVNVNITLIFSVSQYLPVANAYISGLEQRLAVGQDISRVASVASFFVSRVDTLVDKRLESMGRTDLAGKAAVANARAAYGEFLRLFSGERWDALAKAGAQVQRPLWASTGTKNPAYSDCLYVDTLVGRDTVNTLPPASLDAVLDHGATTPTIDAAAIDEARATLTELLALGIDVDGEVAAELQRDGVKQFVDSFRSLTESVSMRRWRQLAGLAREDFALGDFTQMVEAAVSDLDQRQAIPRVFARDHTLWSDDPTELANRLGWVGVAEEVEADLDRLRQFGGKAKADGFTTAVVIGMGGSSLAPEVFGRTLGNPDGLRLEIADSTHPEAVQALHDSLDLDRTLFIVATKSGGTVETFSIFRYFYRQLVQKLGAAAGGHFIAITDPGSALETLARDLGFRATFLNNPNIGGRFSALSHFGMVPAALAGAPIDRLLAGANRLARATAESSAGESPALLLGAAIGELAKAGRDKLTFVLPAAIAEFGAWLEQLIAESTGKHGTGILPVVATKVGQPDAYREDRVFVDFHLAGESVDAPAIDALRAAGHPVITVHMRGPEDLGAQMWLWEFATAIAGQRLGINPFDQPNVESAKVQARAFVDSYRREGRLPHLDPALEDSNLRLYGDITASNLTNALTTFLAGPEEQPLPYVAIQAFLPPSPEVHAALDRLRATIEQRTKFATAAGIGPRYLHSTGQLHKGDAGHGLCLQLVAPASSDLPIPDETNSDASSMSFGALIAAQALGDRQALLDAGRRFLRVEIGGPLVSGIDRLTTAIASAE